MKDEDQLNLLGMLHYLIAGFMGLMACFPMIYLGVGIAIVMGGLPAGHGNESPPEFLGWILIVFASMFILLGWTYAACLGLTGRGLRTRRWRTFCIVMSAISCLQIPFGTAFGIFTIHVLTRPSVKMLFETTAALVPSEGPPLTPQT